MADIPPEAKGPAHADAVSFIDRFASCRILCIGDVMLDRFIYGTVERISPEAPIPVFSIREERSMLGGAGNVARNLTSLGAHTTFLSVIGNDKTGHELIAMIGAEPLANPYLVTENGRISTTKTRFVAGMQQVLRADREIHAAITQATTERILDTARKEIQAHDVMLLSDYAKGLLTSDIVRELIAMAQGHGKPVLVDPKSRDFGLYEGATLISPNLHELANAAGVDVKSEADIIAAGRRLMADHAIANMLITRSRDGMLLLSEDGANHPIPVRAQEVADVSGAGDTAIATLTLMIAAGASLIEAAQLANLAAGIVVGRLGTAVVTPQDLKTALFAEERSDGVHKILPIDSAGAQAEQWRRDGKKVGFTNGCFDLMHSGHLALLSQARSQCDRLIVGLNSDASVKRLKGETRPVNGEIERALMLAALSAVDMVVIFEEDTPLQILEQIRPDLLIKGSDYQKHEVVGYELVESYGGSVLLVPLKPGYSTTNLIRRLA